MKYRLTAEDIKNNERADRIEVNRVSILREEWVEVRDDLAPYAAKFNKAEELIGRAYRFDDDTIAWGNQSEPVEKFVEELRDWMAAPRGDK